MKASLKIFTILFSTFVIFVCVTGVSWYKMVVDSLMDQAISSALEEHKSLEYITKQRVDEILDKTKRSAVEADVRQTLQSDYTIGTDSGLIVLASTNHDKFGPLEIHSNLAMDDIWLKTYQSSDQTVLVSQQNVSTSIKPMSINLRYDLTSTKAVIDSLFTTVLSFMMISVVGSGILAHFLAKHVVKPTETLVGAIDRITEGDLDTMVDVKRIDNEQVANVAHQFNAMMEAINRQLNALADTNEAQQEFIQFLSHEIKTPLTSIIGNTSVLLSEIRDETHQEVLVSIFQESQRLKSLSLSLLKVYQADNSALQFETVEARWFEESVRGISKGRQDTEIDFQTVRIALDPSLIYVVLLNLMTNAYEAIGPHRGIVKVKGVQVGMAYQICIENERTFRNESPIEKTHENFGLGLSLVEKILTLHHGTLETDFSEDYGSACVRLPLRGNYES